ncbi:hypothetical protein D3C71_1420740 [compost metagenome]
MRQLLELDELLFSGELLGIPGIAAHEKIRHLSPAYQPPLPSPYTAATNRV